MLPPGRPPVKSRHTPILLSALFICSFLSACGAGLSGLATGPIGSFTLTLNPSSITVGPDFSGETSVAAIPANGFDDDVIVTISGLPSGVSVSPPAPYSLVPVGGMPLQFNETNAKDGTYTVTFTGKSRSLRSTATLLITVQSNVASSLPLDGIGDRTAYGLSSRFLPAH